MEMVLEPDLTVNLEVEFKCGNRKRIGVGISTWAWCLTVFGVKSRAETGPEI